jgi:hypothetical protein
MSDELTELVRKIHGLLELLAEDKIAARDAKQRAVIRKIVGTSAKKQQSVLLMSGALTQKEIWTKTGVHRGNLSTLIGELQKAKLLDGDKKKPKLAISIPATLFENHG